MSGNVAEVFASHGDQAKGLFGEAFPEDSAILLPSRKDPTSVPCIFDPDFDFSGLESLGFATGPLKLETVYKEVQHFYVHKKTP